MNYHTLRSLNDLIDNLLPSKGDIFVYRGVDDEKYAEPLVPKLLRYSNGLEVELESLERFSSEVEELSKLGELKLSDEIGPISSTDKITMLELAQHYDIPTRLLDFSYSFEVSLFFACQGSPDRNGALIIFNRSEYERQLKEIKAETSNMLFENTALKEWYEAYLNEDVISSDGAGVTLPMFVDAKRRFPRLEHQKGLFLLWGYAEGKGIYDDSGLDRIVDAYHLKRDKFWTTIVIPKEQKQIILNHLNIDYKFLMESEYDDEVLVEYASEIKGRFH